MVGFLFSFLHNATPLPLIPVATLVLLCVHSWALVNKWVFLPFHRLVPLLLVPENVTIITIARISNTTHDKAHHSTHTSPGPFGGTTLGKHLAGTDMCVA